MNAAARLGIELLNAVQACRFKRHTLRGCSDGVIVSQPGKPDLLITTDAAHRFAQQIEEAEGSSL